MANRTPPSLFPLKPRRENKGTQRYISFRTPLMLTETPPSPTAVGRGIPAVAGFIATEGEEKRGRDMETGQMFGQLSVSCGAYVS